MKFINSLYTSETFDLSFGNPPGGGSAGPSRPSLYRPRENFALCSKPGRVRSTPVAPTPALRPSEFGNSTGLVKLFPLFEGSSARAHRDPACQRKLSRKKFSSQSPCVPTPGGPSARRPRHGVSPVVGRNMSAGSRRGLKAAAGLKSGVGETSLWAPATNRVAPGYPRGPAGADSRARRRRGRRRTGGDATRGVGRVGRALRAAGEGSRRDGPGGRRAGPRARGAGVGTEIDRVPRTRLGVRDSTRVRPPEDPSPLTVGFSLESPRERRGDDAAPTVTPRALVPPSTESHLCRTLGTREEERKEATTEERKEPTSEKESGRVWASEALP